MIVIVIVIVKDWIHVDYGKHGQALLCSALHLDRSYSLRSFSDLTRVVYFQILPPS